MYMNVKEDKCWKGVGRLNGYMRYMLTRSDFIKEKLYFSYICMYIFICIIKLLNIEIK